MCRQGCTEFPRKELPGRVPVDRMVETAAEIRTEGNATIVPVLEEDLVVEKRLMLKEKLLAQAARRRGA